MKIFLAGGSGAIETLRAPDWLAPWIPPELAVALAPLASVATPAVKAMLDGAPALADGLSVTVWVVWALGSILVVVLGLVLSGWISVARRWASQTTSPSTAAAPRS